MISSQMFTKNIRLSGPVINDFIPYLSCEKLSVSTLLWYPVQSSEFKKNWIDQATICLILYNFLPESLVFFLNIIFDIQIHRIFYEGNLISKIIKSTEYVISRPNSVPWTPFYNNNTKSKIFWSYCFSYITVFFLTSLKKYLTELVHRERRKSLPLLLFRLIWIFNFELYKVNLSKTLIKKEEPIIMHKILNWIWSRKWSKIDQIPYSLG